MWACGKISCHSGAAHVTGGVISLASIGVGWYAGVGCCANPRIGRSRWMLVIVTADVAGTMFDGADVRLA